MTPCFRTAPPFATDRLCLEARRQMAGAAAGGAARRLMLVGATLAAGWSAVAIAQVPPAQSAQTAQPGAVAARGSAVANPLAISGAPAASCLANARPLGTPQAEGFSAVIDGTKLRRVSQLDRERRRRDGLMVVEGGDFSGQSFTRARLDNVCFVGTQLRGTDWTGVSASGVGFIDVDLTGARMATARMPYVLIRQTTLTSVDASNAVWTQGRLDGGLSGSLERLKLDGANMQGFVVACGRTSVDGCPTNRTGLSARGTDFTNAQLATFLLSSPDLTGVILNNTHIGVHHVGQLSEVDVRGPITIHSLRQRATLSPEDYRIVRAGVTLGGAARAGAGLDCAAPAGDVQRALCAAGPEIQSAERQRLELSRIVGAADRSGRYAALSAAFTAQQEQCAGFSDSMVATCLSEIYTEHLARLQGLAGAARAAGGTEATNAVYVALRAGFSPQFRASPQFSKLVPVLADAAPTSILVRPGVNGTVSLRGRSDSGCRVRADDLVLDARTGWYGTPSTGRAPVYGRRGRLLRAGTAGAVTPLVKLEASGVTFADDAAGTILTCPTGATLDPTQKLDVPALLVRSWWPSYAPATPAVPAAQPTGSTAPAAQATVD